MGFSSANALTTLLTTESLLFAVFALTLSFGSSSVARTVTTSAARQIAATAAGVLTFLGAGAAVAWVDLFVCPWPGRFAQWFPAVAIAVGILAQPVFAWSFVVGLSRGPTRGAVDGLR